MKHQHGPKLGLKRVVIIHGHKGQDSAPWQRWLATECKQLGLETYSPRLQYNDSLRLPEWLEALNRTLPLIDQATALIGHGAGCLVILQILRTLREREKVGLVVLVSPLSAAKVRTNGVSFLMPFYEGLDDRTLKLIGAEIDRLQVIRSTNDNLVQREESQHVFDQLGEEHNTVEVGEATKILARDPTLHSSHHEVIRAIRRAARRNNPFTIKTLKEAGHIDAASGHQTLPEVLELVRQHI